MILNPGFKDVESPLCDMLGLTIRRESKASQPRPRDSSLQHNRDTFHSSCRIAKKARAKCRNSKNTRHRASKEHDCQPTVKSNAQSTSY